MAYNGMSSIPSVTQRPLSLSASAFSSFQTPAITVPFPSVYGGQVQIPFTFSATPTYAASRVRSTIGGNAATAGIHSINSIASEGGYRDHGSSSDGSSGGSSGGGGWPTWATAVIASVGGVILALTVLGLCCWRWKRKQRRKRERGAAMLAQTGGNRFNANTREKSVLEKPMRGSNRGYAAPVGAAAVGGRRDSRRPQSQGPGGGGRDRRSQQQQRQSNLTEYSPNSRAYPPPGLESNSRHSRSQSRQPQPHRNAPHAVALGIHRPTSIPPSSTQFHSSQPQSRPPSQTPSQYGSAYPIFAAPRPMRQSFDSPSRSGYTTPPPRNRYPNHSLSSTEGSPAQLLASHHRSQQEDSSPRSSFASQSTKYGHYAGEAKRELEENYPDPREVQQRLDQMQFANEHYRGVERGGGRGGYQRGREEREGRESRASTSYDTAEEEEEEDDDRGQYYGFAR
ncbi:hypothetical protein JCM5353_002583 [Sporobolomyces roseus]